MSTSEAERALDHLRAVLPRLVFVIVLLLVLNGMAGAMTLHQVEVGEPEQSVPDDAAVETNVPHPSEDVQYPAPVDRITNSPGGTIYITTFSPPDVYASVEGDDYAKINGKYYPVSTETSSILSPEIRHDWSFMFWYGIVVGVITMIVAAVIAGFSRSLVPGEAS